MSSNAKIFATAAALAVAVLAMDLLAAGEGAAGIAKSQARMAAYDRRFAAAFDNSADVNVFGNRTITVHKADRAAERDCGRQPLPFLLFECLISTDATAKKPPRMIVAQETVGNTTLVTRTPVAQVAQR